MKFTPLELARSRGHHQIADYIKSELVKMEQDLKVPKKITKGLQTTEEPHEFLKNTKKLVERKFK